MAPKEKKKSTTDFASIFNSLPKSSAGNVTPPPGSEGSVLDPREFPEVPRPDIPEVSEQAPQAATDNSVLGKFISIMDNVTPDDMGGMIRGTSGFLSNVPGYKETVGAGLGLALSGGESVINAIDWGTEQMNHLGAALASWAPGGIATLDWEQSKTVSFGQVVQANAGISAQEARSGNPIGALLSITGTGIVPLISVIADPNQPVVSEDNFNILDPEFRKRAFEENQAGKLSSGFSDAVWTVAADPTIVGGKVTNVLRFGTKAGTFAGLTNRALKSETEIRNVASELADQGRIIKELGVDSARQQGLVTAQGEYLIAAMEGNVDNLVNHVWVKGSSNNLATRRLLAKTSMQDPETAAALAGAMMGDKVSWKTLIDRGAYDLYDDLSMSMAKVDPLSDLPNATKAVSVENAVETLPDRAVDVVTEVRTLSPQQIQYGDGLVDKAIDSAIVRDPDKDWGQLIQRGGMSFNASGVRLANAWRRGATAKQFENKPFSAAPDPTRLPVTDATQWVAYRLEDIASSRPITLVRWLGQGTPTGIIHLKGGDGTYSLNELSAFLRKSPLDQNTSARLLNQYAMAQTPGDRFAIVREIEKLATDRIAVDRGLSPAAAEAVYKSYAQSRHRALAQNKNSRNAFSVDPVTGETIVSPQYYTQLEEAWPMIDLKTYANVIDQNHSWLKTVEDVKTVADSLNSAWKISVLLRLGYTQRNIAEGALRSFAVLGAIAANPRAWAMLPSNTMAYAGARYTLGRARRAEKDLNKALDNLYLSRASYSEAMKAAGWDELGDLKKKINKIEIQVRDLSSKKRLTIEQQGRLVSLQKKQSKLQSKYDTIFTERFTPAKGEIDQLLRNAETQMQSIDGLSQRVLALQEKYRLRNERRKLTGKRENIVGYDAEGKPIYMQGAFQGLDGERAAMLSSADATAYQTFDAAVQTRLAAAQQSADWKRLDPSTLSPKDMRFYWDEYTRRLNREFRGDPLVRLVFGGKSVDEIKAWLRGPEGAKYRKDLSIPGRRLDTEEQVDTYLNGVIAQLDYEVPIESGLREMLLSGAVTSGEIQAKMGTKSLPVLIGMKLDDASTNLFFKGKERVESFAEKLMRGLGSIPETKVLRHPFYNQIYRERQRQMWQAASAQGVDVSDAGVKARINQMAHSDALKATRDTMYTIERYSNAAELLRFVSPFFPAFENSIRVWGGIVYRDPAVLGIGNLLWNIPNNLGWVVDAEGQQITRSNMFKDENTYIVWPEPVANLMRKEFGPFTPGEAIRSRQAGLNVVFPGGEWWWPGVGPMTQIPTALILRGKPEEVDVLRSFFGETKNQQSPLFQSILPGGSANVNLLQSLMPTWARRWDQMRAGESSNSAYLTSYTSILEDAYIQAQIDGRTLTDADMKNIQKRANDFWKWQITAAVALPFQSSYLSPFQMQRDAWQKLIDDQSIPYAEKVRQFTETYGTEFLSITRSTSYNETELQPNIKTWQRITKNPDLVKKLYNMDPEIVGLFGNMGSYDDPFSYAVYTEYQKYTIDPTGLPVSRKLTPDEVVRNNEISDGWREWHLAKDYAEDKATSLGYSSLEVKEAQWLRDELNVVKDKLIEKYPAWGNERDKYMKKLPQFIRGARMIVENGDLVGEDTTISALQEYLKIRDYTADIIKGMTDQDVKDSIKQDAYVAINALRMADIGFADMYDQYFSGDDFQVVQ